MFASWIKFGKAFIALVKLAAGLQTSGAKSFYHSWRDLLNAIQVKSTALK
jgi:hypothetical protein